MADPNRNESDPTLIGNARPRSKDAEDKGTEDRHVEDKHMEDTAREDVRSSDRDRAVRPRPSGDVDPDSPDAGIDRDDIGNV